jgi:hypothetical protein
MTVVWTPIPLTDTDLSLMFKAYYRYIDLQTVTERDAGTNTDADILWNTFLIYESLAEAELPKLLTKKSIAITDLTADQVLVCYCHIIADHYEQGNPDWNYASQSQAPGVSFSRRQNSKDPGISETSPRAALDKLLDDIAAAVKMTSRSGLRGELTRTKDSTNYPLRWKRTGLPAFDPHEDGYDENEVSDFGVDYNDGYTG